MAIKTLVGILAIWRLKTMSITSQIVFKQRARI